jgi:hypothetical protein
MCVALLQAKAYSPSIINTNAMPTMPLSSWLALEKPLCFLTPEALNDNLIITRLVNIFKR